MTNNPIFSDRGNGNSPKSAQEVVDHLNGKLERPGLEWFVGKDGKPHLGQRLKPIRLCDIPDTPHGRAYYWETTIERIANGYISQREIDALPDRIKRIAYNRFALSSDSKGNYWLPKSSKAVAA